MVCVRDSERVHVCMYVCGCLSLSLSVFLVLIFCLFCPILLCLFQLPICLHWEREKKECGCEAREVLSWEEQGVKKCDQNILYVKNLFQQNLKL